MQVSMGKESRTTDMERIEKMTEHTIEHAIEYTSKDEGLIGNEKIEEAIAALQQEPNEALLAHALTVIRRRMSMDRLFWLWTCRRIRIVCGR